MTSVRFLTSPLINIHSNNMGCTQGKTPRTKLSAFKLVQEQLLLKMYTDVAIRSAKQLMTKENFYIFFHINGLWGQEIFDRFDKDKSGLLTFQEFKNGVEELVKGSFRKKVMALFQFYDIDKTGNISYGELLKMLYSYPKQQLVAMMQDHKFLKSMDKHERDMHFNKVDLDEAIIEQVEESEDEHSNRKRRMSDQIVDSAFVLTPQTNEKAANGFGDALKNAKGFGGAGGGAVFGDFTQKHSKKFTQLPPVKKNKEPKSPLKRGGSMSYGHEKHMAKRKIKITSNITLLVKKFATYLFQEEKLDTTKDNLNQDQFAKIIQGHQKIFASYFEGFHNYIWQVPGDVPQFITNTSWIQGECIVYYQKQSDKSNRYLRFYKNTLFVFKSKTKIQPQYIINMQGLFVQQLNHQQFFGFIIKHRDGIYPQKAYLFTTHQQQADWLRQLSGFRKVSILDQYTIEEKIGAGNFSVVYKGVEKKSGEKMAIKSIEKFKLSVAEKEVIKHQCGILRLCIHPSIVRFIEKSETKTHMYIVTELMNEGDLDQYVKGKTFLEEYEASIIAKQLIEAVIYLNSLGLIHRDLKPENIMLRKSKDKDLVERIKLIDFGFAVYKTTIRTLPEREKFVGTPNFVAPEVLQTKDYDEKVDNFSIGVIMYFMLSGSLPFDSPFHDEIGKNTIDCNYTLDNAHWSNVTDNAKDLITKLICKKQERISLVEAIKHPWITHYQELKAMIGSNKKSRYI